MPTPKEGYYLKDGSRVPGTTTVIGRFKNSGGLMQWAFKQGKEGRATLYEEAQKAADTGTVAHAMVEARIKDPNADVMALTALLSEEMRAGAASAFQAYETWAKNFDVKVIAQEVGMVSEEYRYGGTLDAVGLVGNQTVLMDYKTSNSIYTDMLVQLAAYKNLWDENHPDQPIIGGCHLLRFSKENGDFSHHYYQRLDDAWEQFKLFRRAYDLDKILEKRAK